MKFSEMPYARPDLDELKQQLQALTDQLKSAPDYASAHEAFLAQQKLSTHIEMCIRDSGIIYCAMYIVIARFGTQYLVLLFMNADEAQSVLDYTQRISYAYAYGPPLLLLSLIHI